jgi:hypothetical protein
MQNTKGEPKGIGMFLNRWDMERRVIPEVCIAALPSLF